MSIAVAVRKDARIVLATDSQTNLGSERVPAENLSGPKFIADRRRVHGRDRVDAVLEHPRGRARTQAARNAPGSTPKRTSSGSSQGCGGNLHERYNFVKDQADDADSPFGSLDSTFLVVCARGIFGVASDLSVLALRALLRDRLRCADRAGRGACPVRVGMRRRGDCAPRRDGRNRPRRVLRPSGPCRDSVRERATRARDGSGAESSGSGIQRRQLEPRILVGLGPLRRGARRHGRGRNRVRVREPGPRTGYISVRKRSSTVATTVSGSSRHHRLERISTS